MEFITAKEAAKRTSQARAEIAQIRVSLAECYVREDIMPLIAEDCECGRNITIVEVDINSDLFKIKNIVINILDTLGYNTVFVDHEFRIKW